MTEQAQPQQPPNSAWGPYPPPGPRWTPLSSDSENVTIKLVANGWIVTAPIPEEDDDDGICSAPWDTEDRVFQFDQKDDMLAYLASATPIPAPPRAP